MHVVVTGGAGFIGSHVVDACVARGWRVTVIDDLSTGDRRNVNARAEIHELDVRDGRVAALIAAIKPDVVSHHAAQMDVRRSVADPSFDAVVNVVGSVRLLQACVEAAAKRFVFASSGGAIYGEPITAPQDESHPAAPLSPYGCAKLAVEHYMHYFREVHGLSSVALRYANVYGPRQSAAGEAGVVAIFATRLLRGERATINGTGQQTRDFVYVDDVVAANVAACQAAWQGSFNVGTGLETSIDALHDLMAAEVADAKPAQHGPAKLGEQLRSVLDGRRLRALAALPEPVSLRDGLRATLEWFRATPALRSGA